MWQSASVGGRVPLGRVVTRRLAGEESVPGPPNGYQVVRFKTDFAAKPGATETSPLPAKATAGGSPATSSSDLAPRFAPGRIMAVERNRLAAPAAPETAQ
jgi:hypothetical protein